MGLKSKNAKNGPMDRFVKKMAGDQKGESSTPPNLQADKSQPKKKVAGDQNGERIQPPKLQADKLQAKEVEPHETHSFEWCCSDKKPTKVTCNKARTVEDVLKGSSQFREIAEKNKNKELVILRDGRAISSHFPCRLIKGKRLNIRYIKANHAKPPVSGPGLPQRKRPSGELVMFDILTKGGKKVTKIMKNLELQKEYEEITVYAYKGEKVKQALKRDGRFLKTIFTKNCALFQSSIDVNTEMSNLVDDLNGKTFKIILLNPSNPPESQPSSLDDADMALNESPRSDSDENQDPPQQSTTTESVNDNKPKEKPELNDVVTTLEILGEIQNSKMTQAKLSLEFNGVVKKMKSQRVSKRSRIQNLFRVEYGKNVQTCNEVKTMKKLMQLSNSVCQVRINGSPGGSGFLLFGKFVLTNAHVVKDVYHVGGPLGERVTVHFSFEGLDQMEGEQELGANVVVEEMVCGEYHRDESGNMHDWALLRLRADQTLPDGLLPLFGSPPPSGGICIIGHPDGGVKKIDACAIVTPDKHSQTAEKHYHENPDGALVGNSYYSENQEPSVQFVTRNFFENVAEQIKHNRQLLTYETCFYFGSSGSPVFDKYCNVVAMHTGGYHYNSLRGESKSVIEYGHPLSLITEHIIVEMVEKVRFDVLKEYLTCSYAQHHNVMTNVKKLVESRNLTAFKNALNNSVVAGDEKLKAFFEFICQTEDAVPMDTDSN